MKERTITFKADDDLYNLLDSIPNKSEFIRNSIYMAMNNICPLCNGTGILNSCQQKHWDAFEKHHHLTRCSECNSVFLSCDND